MMRLWRIALGRVCFYLLIFVGFVNCAWMVWSGYPRWAVFGCLWGYGVVLWLLSDQLSTEHTLRWKIVRRLRLEPPGTWICILQSASPPRIGTRETYLLLRNDGGTARRTHFNWTNKEQIAQWQRDLSADQVQEVRRGIESLGGFRLAACPNRGHDGTHWYFAVANQERSHCFRAPNPDSEHLPLITFIENLAGSNPGSGQ